MAAYLSVIRKVYIGDELWAFKCLHHHQLPQCMKSHGHLLCVICALLYKYSLYRADGRKKKKNIHRS
jgi:hypothetical protein